MRNEGTGFKKPSFSECDGIAEFYKHLEVNVKVTEGPLGGKSFLWIVQEGQARINVRCFCDTMTFGWGKVRIDTPESLAQRKYVSYNFKGHPQVDPRTSEIVLRSPVFKKEHKLTLPVPDAAKKNKT